MARKRTSGYWLRALLSKPEVDALLVAIVLILVLLAIGVKIPLWLAFVAAIGIVFLVYLMHIIVIPALRRSVTGREGMIGKRGRVVQTLTPVGRIAIGAETWRAESVGDEITAGDDVEVVATEGITLKVRRRRAG